MDLVLKFHSKYKLSEDVSSLLQSSKVMGRVSDFLSFSFSSSYSNTIS